MKLTVLVTLFSVCISSLFAALDVDVSGTSAILINSTTGKVLFEKNASSPMYPASCTKIAFALYAIKFHEPLFNKRLQCSRNALKTLPESQKSKDNFSGYPSYILESDASHMGLKVGEEMTFYELLEATMVVSADDASNMIAEEMGNGSIEKCVDNVNRYMTSLGLSSTRFMNPHGLHHPEHVTTAKDLAKLSQEAMKNPIFRKMAAQPKFIRPTTNKQASVHLQGTNRLLVKGAKVYYAPATGGKTGYHRRAGHCLVATAEKNGRSLIAVVLQSTNKNERFSDVTKLFEAAFQEKMRTTTFLTAGPKPFSREVEGGATTLHTYISEPVSFSFYPSEEPEMRCQLVWKKVFLPLQKGAEVGELHIYADGQIMKKAQLFAVNDVEETFFYALTRYLSSWMLTCIGAVIGIGVFVLSRRTKHRR